LLDKKHLPDLKRETCLLEDCLFFVHLRDLETSVKALQNQKSVLQNFCEQYQFITPPPFPLLPFPLVFLTFTTYLEIQFGEDINIKQRILRTLQQAALGTLVIQEVAEILSNPATNLAQVVDTWHKPTLDLVRSLLAQPPPPNAPANADLFLLQSLRPHQQLLKVLKSNDLLAKLNLQKWFVNESIFRKSY
jgi:hypothetical protein